MKYPLLLFFSLILMSQQCRETTQKGEATKELADCIDTAKIKKDAACTMIYKPVCGCDGTTYSNACVAGNNGLLSWTEGECDASEDGASI